MDVIEIWQPRWKDRVVLIATYRVVGQTTKIKFTKAKSLGTSVFEISSDVIKRFPIESNGTISCYAVPLDLIIGKKPDEKE
jgi:hypothetical protein